MLLALIVSPIGSDANECSPEKRTMLRLDEPAQLTVRRQGSPTSKSTWAHICSAQKRNERKNQIKWVPYCLQSNQLESPLLPIAICRLSPPSHPLLLLHASTFTVKDSSSRSSHSLSSTRPVSFLFFIFF